MRLLVTGAGGFLGRSVVARLLTHGATGLRCQVRQAKSAEALRATLPREGAQVEIVAANLLSRDDIARLVTDVEVIVHLAAGMRGAPSDMCLNTVVATRNLLDAVSTSSVRRVVLVSSFAVYGTHDLPTGATIDEQSPLEPHPEHRDGYALAKLLQEEITREHVERSGRELVVLRPGVVYGPGGGAFSNRVGVSMFGWFLHLGGSNLLPLSYVDNCAEAIALASGSSAAAGGTFNVHDDDLPTCREYLRRYKREVGSLRSVPVPYWTLMLMSRAVESYHRFSKGQLPAAFTPYATQTLYRGRRYSNNRLKSLGWRQIVPTEEGLKRMFAWLRSERASS